MKLTRDFYEQPVLKVAKDLLGKTLVHVSEKGIFRSVIVETEAYDGTCDKGCHAYPYKRTPRTDVLFGPGGHAYVYLIYGMYYCFNVVSCQKDYPAAVLIRAARPKEGTEQMAVLRKQALPLTPAKERNLCNGPGKLCQAMDITKKENGLDLCGESLFIEDTPFDTDKIILTSPRINIDYAEEAAAFPWRFTIKDDPYLSVRTRKP